MVDALTHFLLVAEHGTFTEAARRAHLTQPAISASIRRLEDDLGGRLFDRGAGGASLTAAGRALLPRARAALAAIGDGRRAVAEVLGLHAGEVRVGAGATACTFLLPPLLSAFRERHPAIRHLLREADTARVVEAVLAGELDLGIVTRAWVDLPPGLIVEPWQADELVLVGPPGDRPPGFVSFGAGSALRDLLDRAFPEAVVVMELNSIAAIAAHVRAGMGVALLSRESVAADVAAGRLQELNDPRVPLVRTLDLVHRGVDRLPPAALALRALLLDHSRPGSTARAPT